MDLEVFGEKIEVAAGLVPYEDNYLTFHFPTQYKTKKGMAYLEFCFIDPKKNKQINQLYDLMGDVHYKKLKLRMCLKHIWSRHLMLTGVTLELPEEMVNQEFIDSLEETRYK